MQLISWENVKNLGSVVFGFTTRARIPGGWLIANKPGPSTITDKRTLLLSDPNGDWALPELTWEVAADTSSGKTLGTTYRAPVVGGWLVGNIIGTTSSSRTLNFLPNSAHDWLADPPPPPPPLPSPTISPVSNLTLTQGTAFSFSPVITNTGNLALTFALVGTLPAGLSLNPANGTISGTPTSAGTVSGLKIQVLSSVPTVESNPFDATVIAASPTIAPIVDLALTQGTLFGFTPVVGNPGGLALTFALVGTLPAGLTLNPQNGVIAGTPSVSGSFTGLRIQILSSVATVESNLFSATVAALPPPPPPPSTGKWLGTNLVQVTDYSTDYPFVNNFYKARPWFSGVQFGTWDDGRQLTLDARGNVLSLASGQVARGILFTAARPVVDYVLSWTGVGNVAVNGATVKSSTANSKVITPAASGNCWIDLSAIDPTNPAKDFTLKRVDQQAVVGLFNPDFINEMKKYACIRFMDWANTNVVRSAASLATDFDAGANLPITFAGGGKSVPLDVMLQLCNEANTDGWFCINVTADDLYVDKYLAAIKAKLNPGLKAYVEFTNEFWNSIFPQQNALGGATFDDKMKLFALRTADICVKVRKVLGAQGIGVIGAQSAGPWWQQNLLDLIKAAGKPLPDAIATAPYFGYSLPDDVAVFTDGRMDAAVSSVITAMKASKAIADKNGIRAVCYEGGCHTLPGTNVQRDPRIGPAYTAYLAGMKAALAGEVFNHYLWISAYGVSGSWGIKEYQYAPATAKSIAIEAAM